MFKKRTRKLTDIKLREQAKPTATVVISGFLGAGKTTMIKRLMEGPLVGRKTILIENDFGDLSLDATMLSERGFVVQSLNQGCICCSLTGEFIESIRAIIDTYHPDVLLIEPSGVGKLSDIVNIIERAASHSLLYLAARVTVVDTLRCQMYYDNFAGFFDDQVELSDLLYLSHTDRPEVDERILENAGSLLHQLNPQTPIYDYSMVVFSVILGRLFLAQVPTASTLIGIGIMFVAFLVMFIYNRHLARRSTVA